MQRHSMFAECSALVVWVIGIADSRTGQAKIDIDGVSEIVDA